MKTYQELRQALDIRGGTLTLSGATLGERVGHLIAASQAQVLEISNAVPGPGDGENETVVITGRGAFLRLADLPVTARFSLGPEGDVQAVLKYQLRDAAPGPAAWTFSRSFPRLPAVWNYESGVPDHHAPQPSALPEQKPYLESLDLFDTAYVAATHASADLETGVALRAGINFISRLRPQGALGVLEATLGEGQALMVHGTLVLPQVTDATPPLLGWERPWDRPDAPGIHLSAPLDLEFNAGGKLRLHQTALRVYSPPSTDWQASHGTFRPLHGYVGRLSIPSANIDLALSADLEWGLPRAFLFARCQGVTLGKLTQLADLAGTEALSAVLPEPLRAAADALDRLELIDVSFNLRSRGAVPVVDGLCFTVGLPGLVWKVWEDQLVVRDISCRFEVLGTAPRSSLAVTLLGTVEIEGVPISVRARGANGFSLFAKLDGGQTVPLAKLMKTYVPGVPPPSDLTVSTLALLLSPGRSYAMVMQLASKPTPWTIPLGKAGAIAINDVSLNLNQTRGASTTGAFAGTASFGKTLTLSVGYTLPGGFALRGVLPKVNLTRLIEELCDQTTALPAGFDLVLENAAILIQKQNDSYTLRAATGVKDFGLFALEIRKVAGSRWGFAAGMNLGSAGLSKLPGLGVLKSIEDGFKLQKLMLVLSSFEDAGFAFPDLAQFNQPQLGGGKVAVPAQGSGVIAGLMLYAEWLLDDGSREQKLLKNLLGLGGTQSATLAVGTDPAKDFRLFVSQKGTLQKQPFQYRFGVQLSGGKPSFFLHGALAVKIQGQVQDFEVATAFVAGGAFLSATMKGASGVDCGPFTLSNLALQVGVNWGGIPSLGIAANIDSKSFTSSVAVFFDSTDPSRSLIAGSLGSLSARNVMEVFVGGLSTPLDEVLKKLVVRGTHEFQIPGDLADALDELVLDKVSAAFAAAKIALPSSSQQVSIVQRKRGEAWHLTDLTLMRHYQLEREGPWIRVRIAPQFYFAPQPTFIGSLKFPQAFYLNAALAFAGLDLSSSTLDISPNKGLSLQSRMDKIVILDERLFSISALQGEGGPLVSLSTFNQPDNPVAEFRLPHFHINGALTILGVKKAVFATASSQGLEFELVGQLVPGVNFDIAARFGASGLGAGGRVWLGVGTLDLGPLGKAKVNTQLEVAVDIDLDNRARDVSTGTGSWGAGKSAGVVLENTSARLVFEENGDLILYNTTGVAETRLWASNTGGQGGTRLSLQGDGNLVIYTSTGRPLWASNTQGQGVTTLLLQGTGDLVLRDGAGNSKWATHTRVDGGGPRLELESSFDFAGQRIHIGRFTLEAQANTFNTLPDVMNKKVEAALRDVFNDATRWADAVGKGALEGVNDTAKVFKDVYKKTDKEAKQLASTVSKGVNQAGQTLTSVTKSTTKAVNKTIKKVKFW
jgi:hypothetical protein